MEKISAPVGVLQSKQRGNLLKDVKTVQMLLFEDDSYQGLIDGKCGRGTLDGIVAFQQKSKITPTGRVDPKGETIDMLNKVAVTFTVKIPIPFTAPWTLDIPVNFRFPLPLPAPGTANVGLAFASNTIMTKKFGLPRDTFSQECQPPTNAKIAKHLAHTKVGMTPVTGFKPAIDVLDKIMADVAREQPMLFRHLGSAGMLCCRNVRGSTKNISNHSWGTAIDITIDGRPEPRGERDAWLGYALLAPIFNRHGWNWGGAWSTPDCHHFECGAALINGF